MIPARIRINLASFFAFAIGFTAILILPAHPVWALTAPLTATATQTSAASTGGGTSGTERIYWGLPAWIEYSVDFGSVSAPWTFRLTAINWNSQTEPNLPAGYNFNIDLSIDGTYKGSFSVQGSTSQYKTGSISSITVGSGVHTVRLTWTNDAYSQGQYDANIQIQSIAIADTTAPTISSVSSSNITSSAATITWTTNELANSQVEYDITTSYGQSTTLEGTLVTSHSVNLSGLSSSTTYHYRVKSADASSNLNTSSDFTFTTSAPPDTTPPSGTVSINSGAATTTSTSATLTLSATDNSGTVSQMKFSDDGVNYSTPEAYATSKSWTLPSLDGTRTVYAMFKDPSGNWSSAASDTILLDTSGGGGSTITKTATDTSAAATGGGVYGTERVYWNAPGWIEYSIDFGSGGSRIFSLTATNWNSPTEPNLPAGYNYSVDLSIDGVYKTTFSVQGSTTQYKTGSSSAVTVASGTHTVRFTWTNDVYSAGQYDANIKIQSISIAPLSTSAPSISPAGGVISGSTQVILSCATSGAQIRYTTDGTTPTKLSTLYSAPFSVTSGVTVKARAFKSGNPDSVTSIASFASAPGSLSLVSPAGGIVIERNAVVYLQSAGGDPTKTPYEYQFSVDGQVKQAWSGSAPTTWIPTVADLGVRTLGIQIRNAAQGYNPAQATRDTFVLRAPAEEPEVQ